MDLRCILLIFKTGGTCSLCQSAWWPTTNNTSFLPHEWLNQWPRTNPHLHTSVFPPLLQQLPDGKITSEEWESPVTLIINIYSRQESNATSWNGGLDGISSDSLMTCIEGFRRAPNTHSQLLMHAFQSPDDNSCRPAPWPLQLLLLGHLTICLHFIALSKCI
jgi:hypothetical protein